MNCIHVIRFKLIVILLHSNLNASQSITTESTETPVLSTTSTTDTSEFSTDSTNFPVTNADISTSATSNTTSVEPIESTSPSPDFTTTDPREGSETSQSTASTSDFPTIGPPEVDETSSSNVLTLSSTQPTESGYLSSDPKITTTVTTVGQSVTTCVTTIYSADSPKNTILGVTAESTATTSVTTLGQTVTTCITEIYSSEASTGTTFSGVTSIFSEKTSSSSDSTEGSQSGSMSSTPTETSGTSVGPTVSQTSMSTQTKPPTTVTLTESTTTTFTSTESPTTSFPPTQPPRTTTFSSPDPSTTTSLSTEPSTPTLTSTEPSTSRLNSTEATTTMSTSTEHPTPTLTSTESSTITITSTGPTTTTFTSTEPTTTTFTSTEPTTTKITSTEPTKTTFTSTEPTTTTFTSTEPTTTKITSTEPTKTTFTSTEPTTTTSTSTEPPKSTLTSTVPSTTTITSSEPSTTTFTSTEPPTPTLTSNEPSTITITSTEPKTTEFTSTEHTTTTLTSTEPTVTTITSTEPTTTTSTSTEPPTSTLTSTEPSTITITSTEPTTTAFTSTEPSTTTFTSTEPSTTTITSTEPTTTKITSTEPTTTTFTSTEPTKTTFTSTEPTTPKITSTEPTKTTFTSTEPTTTTSTSTEPPKSTLISTVPSTTTITSSEPSTTTFTPTEPPTPTLTSNEPSTITITSTEPTTTEFTSTEHTTTTLTSTEPTVTTITSTEPITTTSTSTEPPTSTLTSTEPSTITITSTEPTTTAFTSTEPSTTTITSTEPSTTTITSTEPSTTTITSTEPTTTKITSTEPTTTTFTSTEPPTPTLTSTEPSTITITSTEPTTTTFTSIEPSATTLTSTESTTAIFTSPEPPTTLTSTEQSPTTLTSSEPPTFTSTEPPTTPSYESSTEPSSTTLTSTQLTTMTSTTNRPTRSTPETSSQFSTTTPDGGWSTWSGWSLCTVTCGSGSRSRYRACDNPAPQYGGANCTGDFDEKENCNERKCSELFPYGPSVGDSVLNGDDVSTRPLRCVSSIPFLGGSHTYIRISSNGLICLGCTYSSYYPVPLDRFRLPFDIIAPLWTDIYPGRDGSGAMYYHVYSEGDSSGDHTQRENMIDKVSNAVNYYAQTNDFKASCVYVATWNHTVLYGAYDTVQIQFVLATDGGKTYGYTFYSDVNILFPPPGRKVVIGYAGQGTSKSAIFSYTDAAFRISQLRGNTFDSANGIFFMTLHQGSPNPSPSALCLRWYWKNIADNTRTRLRNGRFNFNSICPCHRFMMLFDGRFQPVDTDSYGDCYVNNDFGGFIPSHICCYHPFYGFFMRGRPAAGSMVSANPRTDPVKYYSDNVVPKENCCYKSDRCSLYYRVRPTGICYIATPFGIFFSFGDPHIDTLDGFQYTFNGWGEYTLMKIDNATFEVQARTSLATSVSGNETKIINATVFSAFAAEEGENSTLQVELTSDLKRMSVFGNGQDFTTKFYDISSNFTEYLSGLVLKRKENFTLTAAFSSGIQLTIQVKTRQLTLSASIPTSFKGMVQGLMGNFDDNKTNEFILPDGTQLPDSDVDTERKIYYNFGQKWATTTQTSMFTYDDGKSWSDYSHPDFVPLFIDEFNQTTLEQAYSVCGGRSDQYKACIFDYLATGDRSFAEDTQSTNIEAEAETEQLKNEAPSIGGDESIEAVVGSPVTLNYFGSDDSNSFVYDIINQPSTGVTANNSTGNLTLTWTPSNLNAENILVTTRDDKGLTAESIEVEIKMCSGCNGNGTCNYEVLRNETNPNFVIASCDCNNGYTGDDCDVDFDGCADDPCALGRNCTDLTPDQQVQFNRSYNCSDCPPGYSVTSDEKCEDINECSYVTLNKCPANSNCSNIEGSYTCPCLSGFRKIGDVCQDIDECTERTSGCDQNCDNTDGSFTCSCVFGFELLSDGKTCNQTITDVCQLQNLTCSYGCDNTTSNDGTWQCICREGYQVENDGSCSNIDECEQNVCTQNCTDSEGSYICSCFTGYKLTADGTTCTACQAPNYGDNCAQICSCGPGAIRCDPSRGCVCNNAWTGPNCDQDVDECTTTPGICGNDKTCTNTNGGYECSCTNAGYEKVSDDNSVPCSDINECGSPTSNNCSTTTSTCSNTGGGYTCTCNSGYQQKNSYECEDVNECTTGSHNCQQKCVNTVGNFNCRCFFGFELNADRRTCSKVSNPCASFNNLTCSYACKLNGTSAECYCEAGYQLQEDGQTCKDIDECSEDSTNLCSDKSTCTNNAGSFSCSCPVGKFLENDQRTCTVCDQFHWGSNCANDCGCGAGAERCDPLTGCVCKFGWQGTKCDADINECNNVNNPCDTAVNEQCVNTPGSYVCQCMTGYHNVSGTCQDIDECLTNPCDQECTNNPGSFICSCRSGFQLNANHKCQDIDECDSTLNLCSQNCLNTVGSYKCSCNDGYILSQSDQRTCTVKTECSIFHCTSPGTCAVRANGEEYCTCPTGYNLTMTDNTTGLCENVNECVSYPCEDSCTDKTPGYICSCTTSGKTLAPDQKTCTDCDDGYWGQNCAENCTCVEVNTNTCHKSNGTCECKTGWKGDNCDQDVNECNDNPCQANSHCQNTNGSYVCVCDPGYVNSNDVCVACNPKFWGTNCAETCSCDSAHTKSCDNVNGICTCNSGWGGTNCTDDLNECFLNATICTSNSECQNSDGSFTCICKTGYQKETDGTCEDINECLITSSHHCVENATCINEDGSYYCACNSGFQGLGNISCTESPPITPYTPNTTEVTVRVVLTLTYRVEGNDNLTNENTKIYISLFDATKSGLEKYYSSNKATKDSFVKVVLYNIIIGSLIADHTVVLNKNSGGSQNNIIAASNNLLKGGTVNIGGKNVNAAYSVLTVDSGNSVNMTSSTSICDAFYQLNTCPINQECSLDTSQTPYCASLQSTDKIPLIVGLGVGVPLFFIILVLVVVLRVNYKKGKKIKHEDGDDDYDDYDRNQIEQGFFSCAIPGRFNSWKHSSSYFNSGLDNESTESDRGVNGNETLRPKDPDTVYDNNRGKEAKFSWDFMSQSNLASPETGPSTSTK